MPRFLLRRSCTIHYININFLEGAGSPANHNMVKWVATLVHAVEVVVNLAIYAIMWFEKVRGGSMHLNYRELVHKHPAHLASYLKMYLQKVRYSRTTPNS